MTPKRVVDSEFGKTVATIREPRRSGRAIYCVDWSTDVVSSQPSPPPPLNATPDDCTARTSSTSSSQCFASCGGRYISIYTVRGDPSNRIVKVKYAYFDEDTSEDFYACAFAGRSSEAFPLDPTDDDEEDAEEDSVDDAVEDTVEDTSAARPPYTDPTGIWPLAEHTGSGPQLLAVAGKTGIIKVLDPVKGRFVACLRQYNEADGETSTEILDLKVSSVDEHLLLSASKDTAICIWNMKLGSCVAMCAGPPSHQDPVVSVAWHPSDTYFASSSSDKTIKIWDIGPGTAVREAIQQSHEAAEAWRNEKTLRILHSPLIVTPCWSSCKLHDGLVDSIQYVGDMILSRSCTEGKEANVNGILLWEPVFDPPRRDKRFGVKRMILPGRVLHWGTFLQQGAGYWFLRLTTNHAYNLLACGNIHGDISLWNLEEDDQQPFVILEGGTEKKNSRKKAAVRSVAFSPQDDLLIAASDNCSIKMWEIHPR